MRLVEILNGFRPQSRGKRNYFRPTYPTKDVIFFGVEICIAIRVDMTVGWLKTPSL
jgi:hypothetical protein